MITINKRAKKFKILSLFFLFTPVVTIFFSSLFFTPSPRDLEEKNAFVLLTKQPDLAIGIEAGFLRHRSLATMFTTFKDSPYLQEYAPSSFVINTALPYE